MTLSAIVLDILSQKEQQHPNQSRIFARVSLSAVSDHSIKWPAKSFVRLLLIAVITVSSQGMALCADSDFGKRIADAQAQFDAGEYSQAEHQLSSILADMEKDPQHRDQQWETAYSLAEADIQLGAYKQANVALTKALSIAQNNSSSDKTELARSWLGLAELQQLQYNWPEAAALRKKASETAAQAKDGAMIQARVLDGDAQAAIQAGHYDKAQELWKEALAIREKRLQANDPALVYLIRNYAVALRGIGAVQLAQPLEVKASQLDRQTTGRAMPQQLEAMNCLAVACVKKDQMQAAEDGFKKVLDLAQRNLPPTHPLIGEVLTNLGSLYGEEHKFKDSEAFLKRALSVETRTYGPTNWKLEAVLNDLGVTNLLQQKFALAESYMTRSLHLREQTFGTKSTLVADELKNLAIVHCDQAKWDEAKTNLMRAKEIYEQAKNTTPEDLAGCYQNIAAMYAAQGKLSEAEEAIRKALAAAERAFGPDNARIVVFLNSLGTVLVTEGKYAGAEPVYKRSFNIVEKQHKNKDPNFRAAVQSYALVLRKLNRASEATALEKQFTTN